MFLQDICIVLCGHDQGTWFSRGPVIKPDSFAFSSWDRCWSFTRLFLIIFNYLNLILKNQINSGKNQSTSNTRKVHTLTPFHLRSPPNPRLYTSKPPFSSTYRSPHEMHESSIQFDYTWCRIRTLRLYLDCTKLYQCYARVTVSLSR